MKSRHQFDYGKGPKKNGFSKGDYLGVSIAAIVISLVVLVSYWNYQKRSSLIELDQVTYCPIDGPYAKTVLLIDLTDEISFIQEEKLKKYIKTLSDSSNDGYLPQYDMLAVYLLSDGDSDSLPQPIVEVCNPGDGSGLRELDGAPILAKKTFVKMFSEPISAAIGGILPVGASKTSPIIEAIRGISVSTFDGTAEPGHENRLVVISDMIQNSAELSFFKNGQSVDREQLKSLGADLAGVPIIDIKVLDRKNSKKLQGKQLVEFWSQYFRASGSSLNSAERWTE